MGECRGWPLRISQAGLLDLCGNEKPLYYRRKALWTEEPFVKIAASKGDMEHTSVWSDSFVYSAEEGETVCVSCYTNASKAELFLNGRSLGEKTLTDADGCRVTWEFPYEYGVLTAKADGAEDVLCSPDKAEKILMQAYESPSETVQVEVTLLDAKGKTACADDRIVYYQLLGDAEIIGIENGKPDDLTCYAEKHRSTFGGRAVVYVRMGDAGGNVTLHAYTKDGLKSSLSLI